jgi:hypothetical protein
MATMTRIAVPALLVFAVGSSTACSDGATGPTDEAAFTAQMAEALLPFRSIALIGSQGGPDWYPVVEASGAKPLEAAAGNVYRFDLDSLAYGLAAGESAPADRVRVVVYSALETVLHGGDLLETGTLDFLVPAEDSPNDVRTILAGNDGAVFDFETRLEGDATTPVQQISGEVTRTQEGVHGVGDRHVTFRVTEHVTPEDEGTGSTLGSWRSSEGLRVDYEGGVSHGFVFAQEDSRFKMRINSSLGSVEYVGRTIGGTGTIELFIDGRLIAVVDQLIGLPDHIYRIRTPTGEPVTPEVEQLVRHVQRTRFAVTTRFWSIPRGLGRGT